MFTVSFYQMQGPAEKADDQPLKDTDYDTFNKQLQTEAAPVIERTVGIYDLIFC